ncbi:hypothetical protein HP532_28760 [Pseudomonas sp. CrR25]|nr:hypothetical protein [Pseudomonas sp. CrR25]
MPTLELQTPVKDASAQEIFGCPPVDFARNGRIQLCDPSDASTVEVAL